MAMEIQQVAHGSVLLEAKCTTLLMGRLWRVPLDAGRIGRRQSHRQDDQLERLHRRRLVRIRRLGQSSKASLWSTADGKGSYHYETRSKASWYWSRTWGACKRLKCRYWVLTDWQRWVFGTFDEGLEHGWVSPIEPFGTTDPSILQYLFFWAKCVSH